MSKIIIILLWYFFWVNDYLHGMGASSYVIWTLSILSGLWFFCATYRAGKGVIASLFLCLYGLVTFPLIFIALARYITFFLPQLMLDYPVLYEIYLCVSVLITSATYFWLGREAGRIFKAEVEGVRYEPVKLDEKKASLVDRLWMIGVTGILFCLLFREELLRLVNRWQDPKESHGFLIPAFSLYFIFQERRRLSKVLGKSSFWGLALMVLSIWGYVNNFFKGFSYPLPLMMVQMLLGIVLFLGGWRILRLVWLPVLFLVFAIPLPARLYYNITFPMRELASQVASVILNSFSSIQCEASGVVIHGTHAGEIFNLNVAEACSGMRLLMAFLALGVAMAYLEYRPLIHRLVLLPCTIPIAIFCNMLRVLLTGLIYIYINPEWTKGTPHTILGMAMLAVAFGLYGLLAWIMSRIYVEDSTEGVLVVKKKG